MDEKLRKALEEGLSKFVFDGIDKAIPKITKEMKSIVQSFGISDVEVDTFPVQPHGVKTVISFDGKCIECILNSAEVRPVKIKDFYKWWDGFESTIVPNNAANDCDKTRWGWENALKWVLTIITKRLEVLSMDDNVACVKRIEDDIKSELGLKK